MSKPRLTKTFLSYTPSIGLGLANTEFPVSKISNLEHATDHFRSQATTDLRIIADLGSVQTSLRSHIELPNFATFKYQESATLGGTYADITSLLSVSQDPNDGNYRRSDDIVMSSKRYLAIFVPSQTPVDGAAYFRLGSWAIPISLLELDFHVESPFRYIPSQEGFLTNRFPGGTSRVREINPFPVMGIGFSYRAEVFPAWSDTVNYGALTNILRKPTNIVYADFGWGGPSWQNYLLKPTGSIVPTIQPNFHGTVDMGEILLETRI